MGVEKMKKSTLLFLSVLFCATIVPRALSAAPADSTFMAWMTKGEGFAPTAPDSAMRYYNRALEWARAQSDTAWEVKALLSIANLQANTSAYDASMANFFAAAELSDAIGAVKLRSAAYNGLGINYYYTGDFDKAQKYVAQSVAMLRDAGHLDEYAIALSNLSGLYTMMGKTDEALMMLREAERLLREQGALSVLKNVYNILGSTHRLHTQRFDSAAYYYTLYVEKSRAEGDIPAAMVGQFNIGELRLLQGDFAGAEPELLGALRKSLDLHRDAYRLGIYNALSDLYRQWGKPVKALAYKASAYALNDSIFERDTRRVVEELELKYQSEQKERRIQEQEAMIKQQQLESERNRRRQMIALFALILFFLLVGFAAWWWRARRQHRDQIAKERSQLYEHIAHEIKTPLTLIKAPVGDLLEHPEKVSPDTLRMIDRQVDRLDGLVNDLMHIDTAPPPMDTASVLRGNPLRTIEAVAEEFRLVSTSESRSIDCHLDGDHHAQWVFAAALPGIVRNLLENAIKYGGSKINVRAQLSSERLAVEVADNGAGMPPEVQGKVFERFYRDPAQAQKAGKGIGLYLVKDALDRLGGSIAIKSAVGQGTTFSIELPLEPAKASSTENNGERPTVLVVEDEPNLAQYVAETLRGHCDTRVAENGRVGLDLALTDMPDLVLTDVMMPEMDGIALLEALKANPATEHIPVVIFSARAMLKDRLTGLEQGADAYLAKPFNTQELLLVVRNLLKTMQRVKEKYRQQLTASAPFDERLKTDNAFLNQVTACVVAQMDNSDYSASDLAADVFLSRSQLHRKLQALSGCSTSAFMQLVRIEYAKDLLEDASLTVAEIAYRSGYSSPAYFSTAFAKHTGVSPSEWRSAR